MYTCMKCATQYDNSIVNDWGRAPETHGYGPNPRCVNLVEDRGSPKAPDGTYPRQVCGGQLVGQLDALQPEPPTPAPGRGR